MTDALRLYTKIAAAVGQTFARFSNPANARTDPAERIRRRRARDYARLLRSELDCALESGEIYLVYQPKLCLRRGIYDGVEALIRWQHPNLGEVDRGSVITIAEESGQINSLTLWVLRQAISDQKRLLKQGIELRFHVNMSGKSLSNDVFVADVCAMVKSAPGVIGFEITETAFIDHPAAALVNFHLLAASGIRLSIDDYGSGHSSLAYLKELPADELKIDKLFVSGMTKSNRDPLIVRSTIDLAHALGMRVVAEGVESHATLALLRVMGCDVAQGFFISPALRIAQLETFLRDTAHLTRLTNTDTSLTPAKAFWIRSERDNPPGAVADGATATD
ncbi:EAL domain-containing protein [Glacieibacterium megasporae]|uniref:EAL domain-containing protein n=1 Tax=Glacieibacterium megasporae TaxID=2835787 RepID=UPI001C1E2B00|nr:EAL domain-containing protein [Polymorphobacter megasporae]UAJ11445.1 EAL domain-containing protein [Polymorphobacter megasporae]